MHHRVLVSKPLKTAWLDVAMRPQRFDGSIYDAAVGSAAQSGNAQPSITRLPPPRRVNVVAGKERSGDQEADQETSLIVTPGAP